MHAGFVKPAVSVLLVMVAAGAVSHGRWRSASARAAENRPADTLRAADAAPAERGPAAAAAAEPLRVYDQWRTYTRRDGLPSDQAFTVRVAGDRVWVGTDSGVAYLEHGRWHTLGVRDGLANPEVLSIDVNPTTGDVWIGTLGGLNRWSAGRLDTFNQFNSGLANNVVYQVSARGDQVWAATAAGTSRFNTRTGEWSIFDASNAPMHESWIYGVTVNDSMVYLALWGGGVVEYHRATGQWRDYRDPDGVFEYDLYPDDGLVSDLTTSVAFEDGILWVGTYTGLSRYDGARWKTYFVDDSGLISNFVNFVRARGSVVWVCTDLGLNAFDGTTWVTYQRDTLMGGGNILIGKGEHPTTRLRSATAIAHNYVWQVDFQGDTVWAATARGVSRGVPRPRTVATAGGLQTWRK
jgi:ligand-binding sensor domain-containing protein